MEEAIILIDQTIADLKTQHQVDANMAEMYAQMGDDTMIRIKAESMRCIEMQVTILEGIKEKLSNK